MAVVCTRATGTGWKVLQLPWRSSDPSRMVDDLKFAPLPSAFAYGPGEPSLKLPPSSPARHRLASQLPTTGKRPTPSPGFFQALCLGSGLFGGCKLGWGSRTGLHSGSISEDATATSQTLSLNCQWLWPAPLYTHDSKPVHASWEFLQS